MISVVFTVFAICGTVLNSFKNKYSFIFWGLSNFYFIILNFQIQQWAQMALFIFNFANCVVGLIIWSRKANRQNP